MMNPKRLLVVGTALAAGALASVSHPFDSTTTARAQSCDYHLSPVRVDGDGAAMSGTITVDTQEGCAWTANVVEGVTSTPTWVALSTSGGTGPGTIGYTVAPLTPRPQSFADPLRQAIVQVRWNTPTAGQNVFITQVVGRCYAAISPERYSFGPKITGSRMPVLAEPAFSGPWMIKSAPDWITFTSPPLGIVRRGDGDAYFTVQDNPSTAPREGVLETCNGSYVVRQVGRSLRGGRYVPADFDDDGVADLAVLRTENYFGEQRQHWFILQSSSGYSYGGARTVTTRGAPGAPHAGDFDGDGKSDFAAAGSARSSLSGESILHANPRDGDVTFLAADFTGDNRTDFVSYRRSTGQWFVAPAGWTAEPAPQLPSWGLPGDIPVPADYDGDARADAAVWRPSDGTWYILHSRYGSTYASWQAIQWGLPGDIPVPGDYDGDTRMDPAVWRPSEGAWYWLRSSAGYARTVIDSRRWQWGEAGDIPVPNDYDGDGRTDLAVWRPSTGVWYLLFSRSNYGHAQYRAVQWGVPGDVPVK